MPRHITPLTQQLYKALDKAYPLPGYLLMKEVRDATGFDGVRSADAIAIGIYRNRGRKIHGYEVKQSRTDWLKELSLPQKAESWSRYCHTWTLLIADPEMVRAGELPDSWGMATLDAKGKMKCIKAAPELIPEPLSMVAVTALLYAARKNVFEGEASRIQEAREEGLKRGEENVLYRNRSINEYKERVDKIIQACGFDFIEPGYEFVRDPSEIGKALKAVLAKDLELGWRLNNLEGIILTLREAIPKLEEARTSLKAIEEFSAIEDLPEKNG